MYMMLSSSFPSLLILVQYYIEHVFSRHNLVSAVLAGSVPGIVISRVVDTRWIVALLTLISRLRVTRYVSAVRRWTRSSIWTHVLRGPVCILSACWKYHAFALHSSGGETIKYAIARPEYLYLARTCSGNQQWEIFGTNIRLPRCYWPTRASSDPFRTSACSTGPACASRSRCLYPLCLQTKIISQIQLHSNYMFMSSRSLFQIVAATSQLVPPPKKIPHRHSERSRWRGNARDVRGQTYHDRSPWALSHWRT